MMTTTTIAAAVGGCRAPPLRSVPSCRTPSPQTLLVIVDVADRGRRRWHEGIWGVVVRMVEEEGQRCCTHSSGSDPTRGGRWGGKRSGVTLVGLRGRHRQAGEGGGGGAARAMAMTTMVRVGWRNLFSFPVVLLCQFFVLAENRLWFYILLMYLGLQ